MPQVVGAAAERRPALRRPERGLPGLGPHGGVGGVLEDAAPGGLEDPPVRGRAVPPNMGAEQADEVGRNRDGAGRRPTAMRAHAEMSALSVYILMLRPAYSLVFLNKPVCRQVERSKVAIEVQGHASLPNLRG